MEIAQLLPIILLVLVFYLFIIRPQGKRRREFLDMQGKTSVGSKVMLTSGIFGTVTALDDETLTLEIAPGVEIEAHRNVVAKIVDPAPGPDAPTSDAAADDAPTAPDDRPVDEDGKA
ncbi:MULTISPECIES: preprotein translocase subunit YajC [Mumia]|uniref:Preprotein translocase subunit YajC n=1 Tax=Mumia xiangluensis TaxID=1678900 RepID=A0ABW1QKI0_9ACTN|nr:MULTISPECIES: preprotein translocase subunit YajC [Mumia]